MLTSVAEEIIPREESSHNLNISPCWSLSRSPAALWETHPHGAELKKLTYKFMPIPLREAAVSTVGLWFNTHAKLSHLLRFLRALKTFSLNHFVCLALLTKPKALISCNRKWVPMRNAMLRAVTMPLEMRLGISLFYGRTWPGERGQTSAGTGEEERKVKVIMTLFSKSW